MAESKKKTEPKKTIIDVSHPDDVKPANTSKPVIVSNRPLLKDPMVVEEGSAESPKPAAKPAVKPGEIKIKPLSEPTDKPADTKTDDKPAEAKPEGENKTIAELAVEAAADKGPAEEAEVKPAEDKPEEEPAPIPVPESKEHEPEPDVEDKTDESAEKPAEPEEKPAEGDQGPPDPDAAAKIKEEEQAKHDTQIQELIDSKKYYLPINAVEKRRSKRVVIAGVLLSLVLALAWADVALDAGLIEIDGVKPVTHFFSN